MKNKKLILILSIIIIISIIIIKIKPSTNKEIYIEKDKVKETSNNIGVYIEQENGSYTYSETIPSKEDGYVIDNNQSACDGNVNISWDNTTWSAVLSNINKDNVNCYLFFKKGTAKDTILEGKNIVASQDSFSGPDSADHTGTLYKTQDNDGISYYFRGAVENNWVKFGTTDANLPVWWRIVRINGDGTIRLIYAGTGASAPSQTDESSVVAKNQYYSVSGAYSDNTYVGFYTGSTGGTEFKNTHSNTTASNVAAQLKTWYEGTGWKAEDFEQYIDGDAGFCNDRTIHPNVGTWWTSEGDSNRGTGNATTAYGPFSRIMTTTAGWNNTEQKPTLICGKKPDGTGNEVDNDEYQRDLYTPSGASKGNGALDVPVGLITADEVVFAGGFGGVNNQSYYLYNNQSFWTMSPSYYQGGYANIFSINKGTLGNYNVGSSLGVRPVINLKANIKLSGEGTTSNPYVVVTE